MMEPESSRVESAGRLARQVGGVVALCAAVAVSVVTVLVFLTWLGVHQGAAAERRSAARCPERAAVQAEVRLGNFGEPDWCVYLDESGREVGETVPAGPVPG
jgi:hypothetical protein